MSDDNLQGEGDIEVEVENEEVVDIVIGLEWIGDIGLSWGRKGEVELTFLKWVP